MQQTVRDRFASDRELAVQARMGAERRAQFRVAPHAVWYVKNSNGSEEGPHHAVNIINVISTAQDIPLSQLPIVTESFTIRNSRMTCPWKVTWSIG